MNPMSEKSTCRRKLFFNHMYRLFSVTVGNLNDSTFHCLGRIVYALCPKLYRDLSRGLRCFRPSTHNGLIRFSW
jgi:hypothetical protein